MAFSSWLSPYISLYLLQITYNTSILLGFSTSKILVSRQQAINKNIPTHAKILKGNVSKLQNIISEMRTTEFKVCNKNISENFTW